MKIIAIADLHESLLGGANGDLLKRLGPRLAEVDVVVLAGDITSGNQPRAAEHILRIVTGYNAHVLAVPGNWDGPAVQAILDGAGVNLHRRHVEFAGVSFLGAGGALPSGIPMPCVFTEVEIADHLQAALSGAEAGLPSILVCHQPPLGTRNDLAWNRRHVGSRAVRQFLERVQPLVCFCGHIHEGQGIDRIGATRVVNPGPVFQGHFAYAEVEVGQGVKVLEVRAV